MFGKRSESEKFKVDVGKANDRLRQGTPFRVRIAAALTSTFVRYHEQLDETLVEHVYC